MRELNGQKNPAIQGLRGLAIISVLCFHVSLSLHYFEFISESTIQTIFSFGKFGVNLFFCISGFVIALSLKRHTGSLSFLRARVLRLWPSLLLFNLCLLVFWTLQIGPPSFQALNFLDFLFSVFLIDPKFVSTLTGLDLKWTTGVLWSLTVEIVFYFSSAISVYLLKIRNYLGVWILICISIAFHIFLKIFPLDEEVIKVEGYIWVNCILYLPWFVLGSSLHDLVFSTADRIWAGMFFTASFVFIVAGNLSSDDFAGNNRIFAILVPLFIVFLMWQSVSGFVLKKALGWDRLQKLGGVSYEYYLIHEILIIWGLGALVMYINPSAIWRPVLYILIFLYVFIIYFLSKLLYLCSAKITKTYSISENRN